MLSGSCLCGKVAYEVAGPIAEVHHCHCGICRKSHAAAFSTYAQAARSTLRFTRGEEGLGRYRSSPPCERTFCRDCGSNLLFSSDDFPDEVWFAIATLDGDHGLRPEVHVWVASKAPWHEIADDLPRFERFPSGG
jgi:hypothetical protein